MPPGSLDAGKAPAKPVPPTAPGAHDGGLEYGVIAPDVAADNMAAHIAAMPEDMPPPTTLTAHAAWMAEHDPFSPEAYETVEDAAKDRAAAAAAAAALVPSSIKELIITKSGFKGILKHRGKYRAQFMENGSIRYLGIFPTPEDAAFCYARHIRLRRAGAEASSSSSAFTGASSAAAEAAASSQLGYTGVQMYYMGPGDEYIVRIWDNGSVRSEYTFATRAEAALFEARHVEAARAAAETVEQALAEAVVEALVAPQPLTAEGARAAAAAEGIVPASSGETSGFGGA
jgi:hypothetical protein